MKRNLIFLLLFNVISMTPLSCVFAAQNLDKIVAIVNDDPITQKELNERIEYIKAQYKAQEKPIPVNVAKKALKSLIDTSIQLQLANQNRIKATDEEVKQAIQDIADRNRMSYEQLKASITSQGLSFKQYKKEIQNEIIISRLHENIVTPVKITDQEITKYLATLSSDDKLEFHLLDLKINLADNSDAKQAKEIIANIHKEAKAGSSFSALSTKYDNEKLSVKRLDLGAKLLRDLPDVFVKQIKTMKVNEISQPIPAANGTHILKFTAKQKAQAAEYSQQYLIKQIVIYPDNVNQNFNDALLEIKRIAMLLQKGEEFELLAKKHSHDTQSAIKGGDLGWRTKQELPEPLANAIATMKNNSISKPIKLNDGWCIIKLVRSRKIDTLKELERRQARYYLTNKKIGDQIEKWVETQKELSYVKILDQNLKN